jgi:hypothetical protein
VQVLPFKSLQAEVKKKKMMMMMVDTVKRWAERSERRWPM